MSASVLHIPLDERVRQSMLREMLCRIRGELKRHATAEHRLDLPLTPQDVGWKRVPRLAGAGQQSLHDLSEMSD